MWRDDGRLFDMLDACHRIARYSEGRTFDEFVNDQMLQDAIARRLSILGEAAKQVSDEAKEALPGIAWREIAGLRDVLVHAYFRVNEQRIWSMVQDDVPRLAKHLEQALSEGGAPTP